jgi:hypothetical protein
MRKLLFQSIEHEQQATLQVAQSVTACQQLADAYGVIAAAHDLPSLTNANFPSFFQNIPGFVKDELIATVEIPAGLNAGKYLELVDMPSIDVASLQSLYNAIALKDVNLFTLTNGVVTAVQAVATKHIEGGNYYIETDGNRDQAYGKLQALCDAANELKDSQNGYALFSGGAGLHLDTILDRTVDNTGAVSYQLGRDKTLKFLAQVFE